ncbi:MAG: hypothetical protein V1877_00880 [Candidatus Tagabacteria bacterium]
MKKVLIVSKDGPIRGAMERVCGLLADITVLVADHKSALQIFLSEEPDFVLVFDYEEKGGSGFGGVETFNILKNSATNEKIFRLGFSSYKYKDYIRMPFELPDLYAKFK